MPDSGRDRKLYAKYAEKYRDGRLSPAEFEEIARKSLRESGYPSAFNCPYCNQVIVRSREPSGLCRISSERVSGEKLMDCTWGKCHLTE